MALLIKFPVLWFVCGVLILALCFQHYHHPVPSSAAKVAAKPKKITLHPRRPDFDHDDLASEEDWHTYSNKGGALTCGLLGTDQTAGQLIKDSRTPPSAESLWQGDLQQQLQTWYWHSVNPATYSCQLNDHWQLSFALRSLRLDGRGTEDGGDNQCWRVEHWDPNKQENGNQVPAINQWYAVGDKEYRSTQAYFEFGINVKGGAIFAFYLEGPKAAASSLWYNNRRDPDPADLPQFRAFSDILWGFWSRDNSNVKIIQYFFMIGITNEETNQLIASCLHNAGKSLTEWPGTKFDTATDEGHALLGSPNGAAFAYFLMQHKAELGHKTIKQVTVFKPETDDDDAFVDPALLFWVQDATGPVKTKDRKDTAGDRARGRKNHVRVHWL